MKKPVVYTSTLLTLFALAASCSTDSNSGSDGEGGTSSTGGSGGSGTGVSLGTAGSSGSGASNGGGTSTVGALPPDSNGLQEIPAEQVATFEAQACDGWAAEPEASPSALVLVVDVSGTMNSSTDSTGEQTKYEVTRDALKEALAGLPANLQVGLTFYPNKDNGGAKDEATDVSPCIDESDDVAVATLGEAGSTQRQAILAALDAVSPDPAGATPTHDAFNLARDMVTALTSDVAKYVAILTDGQPTLAEGCYGRAAPRYPEDTQPIIDAIGTAYADSAVKTFMVGSPGSEANAGTGEDVRDWLSAAARAGQTSTTTDCTDEGPDYCHLDMTQAEDFGAALAEGLDSIASRVIVKCLYDVPAAPEGQTIDGTNTNLIYGDGTGTSYVVLQNGAETCDKGWHFINDGAQIEICGQTCTEITSNASATLSLLFGCIAVTVDAPLT